MAAKARRRQPPLEVDFNATPRQVNSSGSSSSSSMSGNDGNDGPQLDESRAERQQQQQQHHHHHRREHAQHISAQEWGSMALLVLLYAMQGIPLGLTLGAMPFLLQSKLSMTQMGLFSISGYPYSFKLFWSPIVDSVYSSAFGRRKSWIVPVQLASAALLILSADWVQQQYQLGAVAPLTVLFFFFVLLAATQDIAVDGWALTLLPPRHIEYASTCQTLGMNTGYFTSFTIFLALSNPEFCNTYIRSNKLLSGLFDLQPSPWGIITLKGYVLFWGWAFAAITVAVALLKHESDHYEEAARAQRRAKHRARAMQQQGSAVGADWAHRKDEIRLAYLKLWEVVKLPAIWALSFLLLTYRLGVLPAESATGLKLLDKGVAKESLAALVLVQFPVELMSAVIAGKWASTHSPYQPFVAGYFVRLAMSVVLTWLASAFPAGASSFMEHTGWFAALSGIGLVTSFSSTLMFTALGSFFNRISDPAMGGAYLTLLNTIANMGVILPKSPLFATMDLLTISTCREAGGAIIKGLTCPKKLRELGSSNQCTDAGHTCSLDMDGFYIVSSTMIVIGVGLGVLFMRLFPRLDKLPLERWRVLLDFVAHQDLVLALLGEDKAPMLSQSSTEHAAAHLGTQVLDQSASVPGTAMASAQRKANQPLSFSLGSAAGMFDSPTPVGIMLQHLQEAAAGGLSAELPFNGSYVRALLRKATPEQVQCALQMTAADWSLFFQQSFAKLVVLLELCQRDDYTSGIEQLPSAAIAAAAGPDILSGRSCLSSHFNTASVTGAAAAAAPAVTPSRALSSNWQQVSSIVDEWVTLTAAALLLNPVPIYTATTINHDSQEQGSPPPGYWQSVVQRLKFTGWQVLQFHLAVRELARMDLMRKVQKIPLQGQLMMAFNCNTLTKMQLAQVMVGPNPAQQN
eukprot:gene8729-8910_t